MPIIYRYIFTYEDWLLCNGESEPARIFDSFAGESICRLKNQVFINNTGLVGGAILVCHVSSLNMG